MQYWVCYDISDDRRRQRLPELLLDFGTRVQESVFQCLIGSDLAEEMMTRVRRTIEEHTDKVHVVALCEQCGERITTLGSATQANDPEYLIV